jgi:hypothetical protein
MARTKKQISNWPNGGRPYIAYRYQRHSTKPYAFHFHRRVRRLNKTQNDISFMSISQTYGTYRMRGMSWVPG